MGKTTETPCTRCQNLVAWSGFFRECMFRHNVLVKKTDCPDYMPIIKEKDTQNE